MKKTLIALAILLGSTAAYARPAYEPAESSGNLNGYDTTAVVTVGSTIVADGLAVTCTSAGNVSLNLKSTSTLVVAVPVGDTRVFPFAVTKVNSTGTTATCTYTGLSYTN